MNNRKSKAKKRKFSDLEGSSNDDSSDKGEDLDSDVEERNSGVVEEDGSSSDSSLYSTESLSSSDPNPKPFKNKKSAAAVLLSDSSESGDENCEKCAICLRSITNQEVGNPEVCDHLFCSVCIIEWSKNSNVCPLDRQQFSIILVRENKNGDVAKKVPVEEPQAARVDNLELEELDETVCEICGSGDREDILLLCDICDRGFHTICLTPPLENIPDENEWFCPDCDYRATNPAETLAEFFDVPSTSRSLRPRIQMVRTRLLERIRVTVNRIVENYVLQHPNELESSDEESSLESIGSLSTYSSESPLCDTHVYQPYTSESDLEISDVQPGTSDTATAQPTKKTTRLSKKKEVKSSARSRKTVKKKTRKRKTTSKKRKGTRGRKRKTKTRKTRVRTTRTKRVKVENADGTITEKIVKTRTYKKKQRRKKYKAKALGALRRGLRVKSMTTPKTVKGRLALTLGMVPTKKPGQLLPDVKIRQANNQVSAINLNRARAGIPKLHIFGPRDELQYYSSDSDHEEFIGSNAGGVATVVPQRSNVLRLRDRKKAVLALQSAPPSKGSKPKHVIEAPSSETVDILGSILDSQALWHSKHTDVKINEDGSIEVIKDKDKESSKGVSENENKSDKEKTIDVRMGKPEGLATQAPMYSGTGSRQGGFRPQNRNTYGESRSGGQDGAFTHRGGQSSTGANFNRFGAPARNDREGYTNYLNNMPRGPTPFCRGGPPLRFRMPPRQQLRRITIPVRSRPIWQRGDEGEDSEEGENENEKDKEKAKEKDDEKEKETTDIKNNEPAQSKKQEEDDVDLYSDIETNADKTDNSGAEDGGPSYPALGPPPEPPAFLLSLEENGEFGAAEEKGKTQFYDPAEPCDSEDEMVIDENKEQSPKKDSEAHSPSPKPEIPKKSSQKASSGGEEDDDDEDCPIFSIYSSATREFSQKEEEERQREIAEDKRKIEEMKMHESQEASCPSPEFTRRASRSRSKSVTDEKITEGRRSISSESEKHKKLKSPATPEKSPSPPLRKYKKSERESKSYESDSEEEALKSDRSDEERKKEKRSKAKRKAKEYEEKSDRGEDSESETISQKVATGLEGLDVEEVSSDNEDEAEFADRRSMSSLSLSELSNTSKRSRTPLQIRKKKKSKKKKIAKLKAGKNFEEGEIDDSEKDNRLDDQSGGAKNLNSKMSNENASRGEKKRRRSSSTGSERQVLGSKENKKAVKEKSKDQDLSWKKPSKKEKNYREGKKRSKERARSRSGDRRKSKSPTPRKDKKKNKDRRKRTEKKKELERYDVRKIVKNKEVRKVDAFGRDIVSKSRSISRSRSRTPIRGRSRNMLRRDSRSYSRSRSRSFRRGRSPVRRRYLRSRTRSRSNSARSIRRSYSRSRSRSRSRKFKRKQKSKDRVKPRSRSRVRKSRSVSQRRRRSPTRSRSRSPILRVRSKKLVRPRRSWSHHVSRSPSYSSRRSRSVTRSPVRVRRSYTRSVSSRSWSRVRSPLPRTSSLEKLTVVLTTKDKKKKKKEGKKLRSQGKKRRKVGNSKEVFASGDNVLVSVNFRNNANSSGNNVINSESRNTRLNSSSPVPESEGTRKKKKGSDYESERVMKKTKKSNPISKKAVDVALSSACTKRAKKLTRLSEKDAEVILNRKPVAVIDLDMSPYREQTPSPVNVVVVSDSGSGDEGKEHTPQRQNVRGTPAAEVEIIQENIVSSQSANVSAPSSPVQNGYVPTSGPKTPPEPQIKFSINKPQQLRQIANPLGDDDDDDEEEAEDEPEPRVESLDRRIEKELNARSEVPHKGPNTPPAPRGPSTPKTPPSPQTSPDAYDPFEPTKSRSPSPSQDDKENRPSPKAEGKDEQPSGGASADGLTPLATKPAETLDKENDVVLENHEDKVETLEKNETISVTDSTSSVISCQAIAPISDIAVNESPERKIGVIVTTPQNKAQTQAVQKPYVPVLKQLPVVSTPGSTAPSTATSSTSSDMFSMPSPTRTRSSATTTTQTLQMTGIQRLQHRLGSPVNRTPNSVKSTPEKRSTPRTEASEVISSGNYVARTATKRNGEQPKQPRPLQDATNETIDMTMDLDDSPYSPASSEGDDLFDPPVEPPKPSQSNSKSVPPYKTVSKPTHKSPVKQLSKFDLLFGPCGPTLSPMRGGTKKSTAKVPAKAPAVSKVLPQKPQKKPPAKKSIMHKMDEDQLRILDDLPSSAVELQVKDKFLKKLNRQERVVDEVKTVLKPHYARKHITKEEYKDILRRSVPKICHSRSGEINPSKIQSLIEAYVRKFRHAKKKGINAVSKPKSKKTMFS